MKKPSNVSFVLSIAVVFSLFIIVFLSQVGILPVLVNKIEVFRILHAFNQKYTGILIFLLIVLIVLLFRIIKARYNTTKNLKLVLVIFYVLFATMIAIYAGNVYYQRYLNEHKPPVPPTHLPGIPHDPVSEEQKKVWRESKGQEIHPIYVADFSKDDILIGASHNVFVGRVLNQSGEKSLGSTPETQFTVEVISNIKGDLKGTVTVNQFGGYKNGALVTVEDDTPIPNGKSAGTYMLEPGQTYLLATRYNEQEDWHTLNSFPTARKLLSKDANASVADLKTLAQNDERVQALTAAYPNEKLLDADIQHGNTRNSYRDMGTKLQAEASKAQSSSSL